MSYVHLNISERVKIEIHAELNYSIRKIAHKLGCRCSNISREVQWPTEKIANRLFKVILCFKTIYR